MEIKLNKTLIIICIILLFIVSLTTCNNKRGSGDVTTVETTYDTTHVTHTDTIPFYNIIDSIRVINLPIVSETVNSDSSEFSYLTEVSDSLLDGRISTVVKSDGTLVNQNFTYLPKFPKYINRVDSIFVTKEIKTTTIKNTWGIYGGVTLVPVQTPAIIGSLGFKSRKGHMYELGYNPFNRDIFIGVKFQLFKK